MSGGVDSSVAALLALQQGLVPRPLFMRNWNELDESGTFEPGAGGATGCTWMKDWEGVQQTCAALGLGRDSAELVSHS
jgi:tRNA-specific 2-thiouridylase